MSEEKTHEDIILCNLQAGYNFMFACPKCKDIIPFALERTTYSGFGTNDFGNNILYDLCSTHPNHNKADEIITKIWFIGRLYAAAIERRKTKSSINDNFYIDEVAPAIINSDIDSHLQSLSNKKLNEQTIPEILVVHKYLQNLFKSLTGLEKRSLSSKYLHFHKPNLFFIYDSRANSALRKVKLEGPTRYKDLLDAYDVDAQYARFFIKAYDYKNQVEKKLSIKLSLREFDKVLIYRTNMKLSESIETKTRNNIQKPKNKTNKTLNQAIETSRRDIAQIKKKLAEKYIKNNNAKKIFLYKATQFKQWANYIAALVLSENHKTFHRSQIVNTLKTELIPEYFNKPGFRETGLLIHDMEISSNHHGGIPCLKRVKTGVYKFVDWTQE